MNFTIDLDKLSVIPTRKTVVAMGLFDGVHKGHKAVITKATEIAEMSEGRLESAVFTFDTSTVTTKGEHLKLITNRELKHRLIANLRIDYIYSPNFSQLREFDGERFVKEILIEGLNSAVVVCGEDFHFGRNAYCGVQELKNICDRNSIETVIVPAENIHGDKISSSTIRKLIESGDIRQANEHLGYDYSIYLPVIKGHQLGRTMNFPTINQQLGEDLAIPKFGVYASYTEIDGNIYRSITNIGVKPTVENNLANPLSETFIIGYSGDLYGETIRVSLVEFVRGERKFSSKEELFTQIATDTKYISELKY